MKTLFLTLCLGLQAFAANNAKFPIGFTEEINASVPRSTDSLPKAFETAREAFEAEYSIENGFVRTALGTKNQLMVVVKEWRHAGQIWNKMIRNGDTSTSSGVSYFHYTTLVDPTKPQPRYEYLSSVNLDQGGRYNFRIPGRPQQISNYYLRMHHDCSVKNSGVVTSDPDVFIQPTRLIKIEQEGNHNLSYYTVNAGDGALLTGMSVTLSPPVSGFFITNCQVDLFINYKN